MKASPGKETIIGVCIVALALLVLFVVIPLGVSSPGQVKIRALSPDFWPNVVMMFMAIVGVSMVCRELLGASAQTKSQNDIQWPRLLLAIVLLFVFYHLLNKLGFVAASMLALPVFMYLGGEKRWTLIAAVSVLLPVCLYYFFTKVATVFVPLGIFDDFPLF